MITNGTKNWDDVTFFSELRNPDPKFLKMLNPDPSKLDLISNKIFRESFASEPRYQNNIDIYIQYTEITAHQYSRRIFPLNIQLYRWTILQVP